MLELSRFDDLRKYVHQTLCAHADLEDSTPLWEGDIVRGGIPLGIEFQLLAPRSVRLSAIWEAIENRILFYDAEMQRFRTTAVRGPDPEAIPERPRQNPPLRALWNGK